MNPRASFTLIELLVVIAIVAVLSVIVLLVINPAELLRQARDSTRLADMDTLTRAVSLYEVQALTTSPGNASTTYFSLVDPTATTTAGTNCEGVGGLAPPSGWSYHCAASSTLRRVDGTGWLPANFNAIPAKPISALPVDPVNTSSSGQFYTYTPGGSFAVTALLESSKYLTTKAREDGGYDPVRVERGSDLFLSARSQGLVGLWKMDEVSGTTAADSSGNGNAGTYYGSPGIGQAGKVGNAVHFDGVDDRIVVTDRPQLDFESGSFSIAFWMKFDADASNPKWSLGKGNPYSAGTPGWAIAHWSTADPLVPTIYVSDGVPVGANPPGAVNTVAGTVARGSWHHFVYVVDRPSARIYTYTNGSPGATVAIPVGFGGVSSAVDLTIGQGNNNYYTGSLDEVGLYARALTPAEIAAVYNAYR